MVTIPSFIQFLQRSIKMTEKERVQERKREIACVSVCFREKERKRERERECVCVRKV